MIETIKIIVQPHYLTALLAVITYTFYNKRLNNVDKGSIENGANKFYKI